MTEAAFIPTQQLLHFLEDTHIPYTFPVIKLNTIIDISLPGKRRFCVSAAEFHVHHNHVSLKLLNKELYPSFPTRFDSRNDVFLEKNGGCFCIEGYFSSGKYKLNIYPKEGH